MKSHIWALFVAIHVAHSTPNIVHIMVDDMGWNDVGYHGSSDVLTPNIDRMANHGLILTNYHTQPTCSPSRAAYLTGRYPIRYGLQSGSIDADRGYGLPLDETLISHVLKKAGYINYYVGKWHLGYADLTWTPTVERGWDDFFGTYIQGGDKFLHWATWDDLEGFDFRDGVTNVGPLFAGQYRGFVFQDKIIDILDFHAGPSAPSNPFYIYASFDLPHAPLQSDRSFEERYGGSISDPDRLTYAAMISGLDDMVGAIESHMKSLDLWDNTLLVFTSDNGGATQNPYSSNFPLRGSKTTLWGGGTRVPAFVSGGVLHFSKIGTTSDVLFHVSDWFPIFKELSGITPVQLQELELEHSWSYEHALDSHKSYHDLFITSNPMTTNQRTELLLNINNESPKCTSTVKRGGARYDLCAGLIMDGYKLVIGFEVDRPEARSGWSPLSNQNELGTPLYVTCSGGSYTPPSVDYTRGKSATECPYNGNACLYDLSDDPCEYFDVRSTKTGRFVALRNRLLDHYLPLVVPSLHEATPSRPDLADPALYENTWSPWHSLS